MLPGRLGRRRQTMTDRVAHDFGDMDPEDAWDAGDPVATKLALLPRIVAHIEGEYAVHGRTARHNQRVHGTREDIDSLVMQRGLPVGAYEELTDLSERLAAM